MQGIGRDLQEREVGRRRQTFYHSSIRSAQGSHHRSPVGVVLLALLVLHVCLGLLLNAPPPPPLVLPHPALSRLVYLSVSSTCVSVWSPGSRCQHRAHPPGPQYGIPSCTDARGQSLCQALAMQWLGHTHLVLTPWSIRAGEKGELDQAMYAAGGMQGVWATANEEVWRDGEAACQGTV